ncbi:MAG: family protein phosphatase [Pseudomonadota bacterium]|nr:family protein phosphatase [Pseudomonadota bacterium]
MLEIAYTMNQGRLSRSQEDCILINRIVYQKRGLPITAQTLTDGEALLAVADGVHSSPTPHRASRLVLEELVKSLREHPEWLQEGFIANRHLRQVQERLADQLAQHPQTAGSATTIVAAHFHGQRAAVLNVGDSRAYQVSAAGQWRRLSKDHTVLQGLIDRGLASPDIEYSRIYMALEHVLCADFGSDDFAIQQVMVTLEPGDRLILCSDGIHDEIGEAQLQALFDPTLEVAAQTKVWRDAVWQHGAHDNLSLIVAMAVR